jgi:hypothetical protein
LTTFGQGSSLIPKDRWANSLVVRMVGIFTFPEVEDPGEGFEAPSARRSGKIMRCFGQEIARKASGKGRTLLLRVKIALTKTGRCSKMVRPTEWARLRRSFWG